MKNIGGTSRHIGFIDECGDHSIDVIDKDFPLFLLSTVVIERCVYADNLLPALGRLKLRYWNHEGVNLHSRDIRKALGSFSFLMVEEKRLAFTQEVAQIVSNTPFVLFVTAIHKTAHSNRHGANARNPYDLALEFTMERIAHFLAGKRETELPLVAEARGVGKTSHWSGHSSGSRRKERLTLLRAGSTPWYARWYSSRKGTT